MRSLLLIFGIVIAPLGAHALDYTDQSLMYTDAPFIPTEAAGISVLTNVGAVEGNPDGSFAPERTLNRAEFLKIVLESHPRIRVSPSDASECFPDVRPVDWFSRYVCLAKKRGIVRGYPDGSFQPNNPVNYAEAIKILAELYDYWLVYKDGEEWYEPYYLAAQARGTLLPISLAFDSPLKRGHMARLASMFLAYHENELELYKKAELGVDPTEFFVVLPEEPEEEAKEAETETGSILEPETGTGSTEEESEFFVEFPARSRLLMLGGKYVIADGTFYTTNETSYIRLVDVEFDKQIDSIEKLWLMNKEGEEIGEIKLSIFDEEEEKWRGSFEHDHVIEERRATKLALVAELKDRGDGSYSEELFKVKRFLITVQGFSNNESQQLVAGSAHFPYHQTVQGKIVGVENTLLSTGSLLTGDDFLLAEFEIEGEQLGGADLRIESLHFAVEGSASVSATRWRLGTADTQVRHECSVGIDTLITCTLLPEEISSLATPRHYRLYADIVLDGSEDYSLQVTLLNAGAIGEEGAIRWTDGSGHFTWIEHEGEAAVAKGTMWK